MANPLFQALGGSKMPNIGGDFGRLMKAFQEFRRTFQGDPKAEVQRLLQSGQMTQEQLDLLQSFARKNAQFFQ